MDKPQQAPDEGRQQTILFAQLVEILTQNAIMMLGAMPDRQGRQRPPDLNGAEMMIELLGVLQKKTKGNLTKEEEKMLTGTLFQLQTAFAEIASKTGEFGKAAKATAAAESVDDEMLGSESPGAALPTGPAPGTSPAKPQGIQPSAPETERKVKFTKKYV